MQELSHSIDSKGLEPGSKPKVTGLLTPIGTLPLEWVNRSSVGLVFVTLHPAAILAVKLV